MYMYMYVYVCINKTNVEYARKRNKQTIDTQQKRKQAHRQAPHRYGVGRDADYGRLLVAVSVSRWRRSLKF